MKDVAISEYLIDHAPLERFYIFMPTGEEGVLMKYFDESGRSWNLMEDDDEMVQCSVAFLMRSGVKVFTDYASLFQFEEEFARRLE